VDAVQFKDVRVLVAGSGGLIGSNLVARLLSEGATVRATFHRKAPVIREPRIEYVQCDLTRPEDCRKAVEGIQHVHLCAATTSGAAAIASTPMIHVTPNVIINTQMLEAAYGAGVEKFIWLGSTVAYPVSDKPMKEEQILEGEPFEKYYYAGWAKRFMEVLCKMYGEKLPKKMTTIVLRPTNVYGPNDDFEFATSHVLPALIRKSVERWDPIEVWGDGSEVRDLIYVDDMVEAMVRAAAKLTQYAALNVGLGKGYSVKEILRCILEEDGYAEAKIRFDPSKPTMIPLRLVDTSKAEAVLGFRAKTDLREGVARTIAWYRRSRGIPRP
jgi:GDP-L-fucose synthase